ncbi:hypothetical protein [Pedobacter frigoris]|uniref:hypothetical protein n=1 Tax=Pedobacter frigoris TaxID=2571272 RepID=UPI00292F7465|nr:hypothetical protein [Pedobacter frigoris]
MKNSKFFVIAFLIAMSSMTTFAQSTDTKSLQKTVETINLSLNRDKAKYLDSFLDNMKIYPGKFSAATSSVRDSARNDLQIEYNSLLLTIFNRNKEKGAVDIKKSMSKTFSNCFKLLNGNEWTKERQDRLEKLVTHTKDLIRKYDFLSEGKS